MCLANRACSTLLHPVLEGQPAALPLHMDPRHVPSQGRAAFACTSLPARPKICLLLAGCSPKARELLPELAAACQSCQDGFPRDCPSWATRRGGKLSPSLGKPPAWPQRGSHSCWPHVPSTWQHISARIGRFWGTLVVIGLSPSNTVHPCASRATPLAIWRDLVMG